jgi:predicted nucleic acid-binding protein
VAELWHTARGNEEKIHAIHCIVTDAMIGKRAGDYLRQYANSHQVELGDALISAAASIHNLDLWTPNRKHHPIKEISFY